MDLNFTGRDQISGSIQCVTNDLEPRRFRYLDPFFIHNSLIDFNILIYLRSSAGSYKRWHVRPESSYTIWHSVRNTLRPV